MILKSIRLHPFAGIRDRTFEFGGGLAVVLGPNEAGKSTLMHAIWNALLTSTSLTARQLDQEMGRYFPANGGDVIRVTMELAPGERAEGGAAGAATVPKELSPEEKARGWIQPILDFKGTSPDRSGEPAGPDGGADDRDSGGVYLSGTIRIQKTWEKGNRMGEARLIMPDGVEIVDEKGGQKKITELLPVSPATLQTLVLARQSELHETMNKLTRLHHLALATLHTLLLARQSEMKQTIKNIKNEGEVRKELGVLLRKSLMETRGVSVDRFRDELESRYKTYFERWDRQQVYPENNRGIRNPYKVGVGRILEAYYKKEKLREELEYARSFDEKMDGLHNTLSELIEDRDEKKKRLEKLEPLKRGISRRKDDEQRLENALLKRKSLKEVNSSWPVLEERVRKLEPEKMVQEEKIANMNRERLKAQKKQRGEQLREKLKRLEALKESVKEAHRELSETKKIEAKELQELRDRLHQIHGLKGIIEGARLTLRIQSDEKISLAYQEAGKPEDVIETAQGMSVEKRPSGGFTLSVKGVEIEVFSGEGDLEKTVTRVAEMESDLRKRFKELDIETLQDAESQYEHYRDNQQKFYAVKKEYQTVLAGDELEALERELEEIGNPDQVRTLQDIDSDLVEARTALRTVGKDAAEAENQLKKWKAEYGSSDEVLMQLAAIINLISTLEERLATLPQLPEQYRSADEFIQHVEQLNHQVQQADQTIHKNKLEKTRLEAAAPDLSSEEIEKMEEEASSDFQRILREGETLAKLRDRALELLKRVDAETYDGLEKSFLLWLAAMAGDRFEDVKMERDLPALFYMDDGRPLPYDLLSHGTKDTVAIAWRFALAGHFLKEKRGLVILDDPMVDMDPARRRLASRAIESFAESHQVILLTCHPEHREGFEKAEVVEF